LALGASELSQISAGESECQTHSEAELLLVEEFVLGPAVLELGDSATPSCQVYHYGLRQAARAISMAQAILLTMQCNLLSLRKMERAVVAAATTTTTTTTIAWDPVCSA